MCPEGTNLWGQIRQETERKDNKAPASCFIIRHFTSNPNPRARPAALFFQSATRGACFVGIIRVFLFSTFDFYVCDRESLAGRKGFFLLRCFLRAECVPIISDSIHQNCMSVAVSISYTRPFDSATYGSHPSYFFQFLLLNFCPENLQCKL